MTHDFVLGKTWGEIADLFVQVWYACRHPSSAALPHHHHRHHNHHHQQHTGKALQQQQQHHASPLRTLVLAGVSSLATKSCRRVLAPIPPPPSSSSSHAINNDSPITTPNNPEEEATTMMMLRSARGTPPLSHASLPICPTCRPGFHELSLAVPRTNHELSRVVCRITGESISFAWRCGVPLTPSLVQANRWTTCWFSPTERPSLASPWSERRPTTTVTSSVPSPNKSSDSRMREGRLCCERISHQASGL